MDFENGNYAILRVAKLNNFGSLSASAQHNFRERDTKNADAKRTDLNQIKGAGSTAALVKAVSDLLPSKRRKDAVICLEYVISASPEHFGDDWREVKNHGADYFKDAIAWLEKRHGKGNVVCTTVHLDESTPHLAVYVVPRTADGRLSAKDFIGGKAKLSKMQTDFANNVGQRYGLKRGIEHSKARHTTIQQYYTRANAAFEPLPEVKTIRPKLRAEPKKPGLFADKEAKSAWQKDHDAWQLEKAADDKLAEQRKEEIKAQQDAALATARRLEAQAAKASMLAKENRDLKLSNSHFVKRCIELESKAKILDLFTSEEIQSAQNRKQRHDEELLRQEKAEREQKELAIEMSKRIKNIPNLLKNSAGAVYTFAVKASEAMAKHSKIDWKAVEAQTAHEAMGKQGQSAESVVEALTKHSPGRADPASHQEIREAVTRAAPRLEAQYNQDREQRQERDSGPRLG